MKDNGSLIVFRYGKTIPNMDKLGNYGHIPFREFDQEQNFRKGVTYLINSNMSKNMKGVM